MFVYYVFWCSSAHVFVFFFKQMTAYEMRISDWSSDVCSSDLFTRSATLAGVAMTGLVDPGKVVDLFDAGATVVLQGLQRYWPPITRLVREIGRASCREIVCQYV